MAQVLGCEEDLIKKNRRLRLTDCDFLDYLENCKQCYLNHFATIENEEKTELSLEESTEKTFYYGDHFFICSTNLQAGKGLVVTISITKNLTNLSRLKRFMDYNIFKKVFNCDYPVMVEEFGNNLKLHFAFGEPDIIPTWDRDTEVKDIVKKRGIKKALISKFKPEIEHARIENLAPKCYLNCQGKMQGHNYLELKNCELLFADKSKEF